MARALSGFMTGLLILTLGLSASAADKDLKKQAFLTAKEAGEDFETQGEYSGAIATDEGDKKFAVQVIALGDGKFRAVVFKGGLPGAGWDRSDKLEIDSETDNGAVTFRGENASGVIENGALVVKNANGEEIAKLEKVTRKSPTLGKKAPKNAVVLFDGSSPKHFKGGRMTKDGLLMEGVTSHRKFGSYSLHVEFMLSFMPHARGQQRSNSGCYMQGRYEVQILDSFGLAGKDNECGGVYEIRDPEVNMCFPPLSWQTYDIDYTAATYDEAGKKTENGRLTVRHNGVLVHDNLELPRSTRASPVKEGPEPGPIYFQNHGNPLRFRNIWLVEKT